MVFFQEVAIKSPHNVWMSRCEMYDKFQVVHNSLGQDMWWSADIVDTFDDRHGQIARTRIASEGWICYWTCACRVGNGTRAPGHAGHPRRDVRARGQPQSAPEPVWGMLLHIHVGAASFDEQGLDKSNGAISTAGAEKRRLDWIRCSSPEAQGAPAHRLGRAVITPRVGPSFLTPCQQNTLRGRRPVRVSVQTLQLRWASWPPTAIG